MRAAVLIFALVIGLATAELKPTKCTSHEACPLHLACINQHCIDPCVGACAEGAHCAVVNHSPICSCPRGTDGNPFTDCKPIEDN